MGLAKISVRFITFVIKKEQDLILVMAPSLSQHFTVFSVQ